MYSMADKYKDIGRKEAIEEIQLLTDQWIDKGKMEGKKEAMSNMIDILFIERFGKVPQQMKSQLDQIDDEKIKDLTRAALKFDSINDYYIWWENYCNAKH